MSIWSRERTINNIYLLLQAKKIAVKDIEQKTGMSVGYLSRMKKGKEKISLEFAVKASEILDTTLDLIVRSDLSTMIEDEKFTASFIAKLVNNVDNHKWKKCCDECELLTDEGDIIGTSLPSEALPTPLFQPIVNGVLGYKSAFHPDDLIEATGKIFTMQINDEASIYLSSIQLEEKTEYELYLIDNIKTKAICHSCNDDYINATLKQLYEAVEYKLNPIQLNSSDKNLLNSIF